MPKSTHFPT